MKVNRGWCLALLLALLAASGCKTPASRKYLDANMDFGAFRNIAVMPFANLSRDQLAAERTRDVFSTMLLASGAVYVVPPGEVTRAVARVPVAAPAAPTIEEVIKLGTTLKADGIITGVVKEYGEVRSGTSAANLISVSVQLSETTTGKVVWAAMTTKGGVTMTDRLFGGGGAPLNDVTEAAVEDLLNKLFK